RRDRPLPVDRLPERVDHAAEHLVADRDRDDAPGALDLIAFLQEVVLAEEHRADTVLLEIERDAVQPVRELEHLASHGALDPLNARDAVAHRDDRADFGDVNVEREAAQLLPDDPGDVVCLDGHRYTFSTSFSRIRASCRVTLPSYTTLPTCVTTPPMIDGSTRVDSTTCRPTSSPSRAASASVCSRVSGVAVVTRACTMPCFWFSRSRNAAAMGPSRCSR